jgi:thioredoxin 1
MDAIPSEDFNKFIAGKSCLLKFSAVWCAPCKAASKILDKVQKDTGVAIYEIDIDNHSDLTAKYGIGSVPTVICIREGEPVAALVGSRSEKEYLELAEQSQPFEAEVALGDG